MTPHEFVEAWKGRDLTERESAQTHFIQLCRVLGVDAPYDNRAHDPHYRFDAVTEAAGSWAYAATARRNKKAKGGDAAGLWNAEGEDASPPAPAASRPEGGLRIVSARKEGHGFADVWKDGCFCWEYKRQGHADLRAALDQLRRYRDSLNNPPLLIVCDVDRFEVHTNFTGYPSEHYGFDLGELADPLPHWATKYGISPVNLLRKAFDPAEAQAWFRPKRSLAAITEAFAGRVAQLAIELEGARTEDGDKVTRHETAHFLMQIVFSLFAEDIDLLPKDRVTRLIQQGNTNPKDFTRKVRALFLVMEKGGDFGEDTIRHFNGGLFKGVAAQRIPKLTAGQLGVFVTGEDKDWSAIEPSILGTLFERALDTDKRAQIGAHYTSRDDIMLIIEPVVLAPLRRVWAAAKATTDKALIARGKAASPAALARAQAEVERPLQDFHHRLRTVSILDPSCGSGNFLYVAVQSLLDLELEVINYAAIAKDNGGAGLTLAPGVSPTQLHGIEINDYAAELARISIWIGFLTWKREKGFMEERRPVLDALDTIETRDAILERTGKGPKPLAHPAKWPPADFIIGNPPFLGSKLFRKWGMQDDYLKDLFAAYDLPKTSDLCCYWFEQARRAIEKRPTTRAGLLATQGIRGGDNRTVLERIKATGDIFMAWADREWVLDGAAVHVSIVGFDSGTDPTRTLNGRSIELVSSDLVDGVSTATATPLVENARRSFMGVTPAGPFDISFEQAAVWLAAPNASGRANADVLQPWANAIDMMRRDLGNWVIDFNAINNSAEAAGYEEPFKYVSTVVAQGRKGYRTGKKSLWSFERPRPEMRAALRTLPRFLATPLVSKHRVFRWYRTTLPANLLIVIADASDWAFGVLSSSVHEVWARQSGTQLREAESGTRYTPTTTFETFPFPWALGKEPAKAIQQQHTLWASASEVACELDRLREEWLNPAPWLSAVQAKVDIAYRTELAVLPKAIREVVRRSAMAASAADDERLKARTLTNLYNERPAWLRIAHERLDRAVLAAYRAVDPKGGWDEAWASVYEPFGAGEITVKLSGKGGDTPEMAARKQAALAARAEIDARILANLLRLNKKRAAAPAARRVK